MIFAKNPALIYDRADTLFAKAEESFAKLGKEIKHAEPKELFVDSALLKSHNLDA